MLISLSLFLYNFKPLRTNLSQHFKRTLTHKFDRFHEKTMKIFCFVIFVFKTFCDPGRGVCISIRHIQLLWFLREKNVYYIFLSKILDPLVVLPKLKDSRCEIFKSTLFEDYFYDFQKNFPIYS